MRAALIQNGVVVNVIVVDAAYQPPDGYTIEILTDTDVVVPGGQQPGPSPDPGNEPVDVLAQIAALQSWARDIQNQVDAATEIIMGGMA